MRTVTLKTVGVTTPRQQMMTLTGRDLVGALHQLARDQVLITQSEQVRIIS